MAGKTEESSVNAQNVPDDAWQPIWVGPAYILGRESEYGLLTFEREDHYRQRVDEERGVYFMRGAYCIKRITMKKFREMTGGKYNEGSPD
jgi:hypothetical protein